MLVTFISVIPLAVMAVGIASGLVILQFKLLLQLLAPAAIVQLVAERVPDITEERLNVAVHDLAADIVTLPSLQSASPDQPVNVEPADGEAERVTKVPEV